jgi:hypothetical protein
LLLQQILGEAEGRVGRGPVNLAEVRLEVRERRLHARAGGQFPFGPSDQFHLVDVVDIDAELRHPLRRVDHRRVDAERAAADQGVGQALEPARGGDGLEAGDECPVDLRVGEVAEGLREADARLVERTGVGQHPHEPGKLRVHVGEHRDGLRAELPGHARVLRPRPHREIEDDGVDVGGGHGLAVAHRDVVAPDDVVAEHHLVAIGTETCRQRVAELPLHGGERLAEEVAAIAEVEEADAEGAGLEVVEHGRVSGSG